MSKLRLTSSDTFHSHLLGTEVVVVPIIWKLEARFSTPIRIRTLQLTLVLLGDGDALGEGRVERGEVAVPELRGLHPQQLARLEGAKKARSIEMGGLPFCGNCYVNITFVTVISL